MRVLLKNALKKMASQGEAHPFTQQWSRLGRLENVGGGLHWPTPAPPLTHTGRLNHLAPGAALRRAQPAIDRTVHARSLSIHRLDHPRGELGAGEGLRL